MTSKTKAKKTAAPIHAVPESREQAEQLLADIGKLQGKIDAAGARANARSLQLAIALSNKIKPFNDEIAAKLQALFIYAQANRKQLLEGDSKTVTLTTGTLSWRFTPPSVHIARGKSEEVLGALLDDDQTSEFFVRTSYEINRKAILDAAAGDDPKMKELVEGIEHLSIQQTEEFVAKPTEIKTEFVETVRPSKGAK